MAAGAIVVRPFEPADVRAVTELILGIQRGEYGLAITAADQPDLAAIPDFYQSGKGAFLVAEAKGAIVGTVGLKDIGAGQGALRKMFVAAGWRGRDFGVSAALLGRLLDEARERGVDTVFLGTAEILVAAHRFYEKNGFVRVKPEDLPASFPRMAVDTLFYRLAISAV